MPALRWPRDLSGPGLDIVRVSVLLTVFNLVTAFTAGAQVGCSGPGPCNDPVPVVNISGVWSGGGGATWTLTSVAAGGSIGVFGNATAPHPNPGSGCPAVTFSVSGTITPLFQIVGTPGTTLLSWVRSIRFRPVSARAGNQWPTPRTRGQCRTRATTGLSLPGPTPTDRDRPRLSRATTSRSRRSRLPSASAPIFSQLLPNFGSV